MCESSYLFLEIILQYFNFVSQLIIFNHILYIILLQIYCLKSNLEITYIQGLFIVSLRVSGGRDVAL